MLGASNGLAALVSGGTTTFPLLPWLLGILVFGAVGRGRVRRPMLAWQVYMYVCTQLTLCLGRSTFVAKTLLFLALSLVLCPESPFSPSRTTLLLAATAVLVSACAAAFYVCAYYSILLQLHEQSSYTNNNSSISGFTCDPALVLLGERTLTREAPQTFDTPASTDETNLMAALEYLELQFSRPQPQSQPQEEGFTPSSSFAAAAGPPSPDSPAAVSRALADAGRRWGGGLGALATSAAAGLRSYHRGLRDLSVLTDQVQSDTYKLARKQLLAALQRRALL